MFLFGGNFNSHLEGKEEALEVKLLGFPGEVDTSKDYLTPVSKSISEGEVASVEVVAVQEGWGKSSAVGENLLLG